jgi:uncharacterized RDD family membrane protein YckC
MILTVSRLLAGATDLFLLASYVLCVCFFASEWELTDKQSPFLPVFATCAPIVYFALLESAYGGCSTIGKRLFGLEVLGRDLKSLSLYQSGRRAVVKVLIPTTVALAALRFEHIVLSVALMILAALIVPVSICVGKGAVGIEDLLAQTLVRRKNCAVPPPVQYRAGYILTVLFVSTALAFPVSALLNQSLWGAASDPVKQLTEKSDSAYRPLVNAILDDLKGSGLSRYVEEVRIIPGLDPFPESFESPLAREIGDLSALKGHPPIAAIEVDMMWRGYESEITRVEILRHVMVVLPTFMSSVSDPGEFFWVRLNATDAFGILSLSKGTTHIVLYRRSIEGTNGVSAALIEPDHFFQRYISLRLTPPWAVAR